MQCTDGAVTELTSPIGTKGALGLMISSCCLEHPFSLWISPCLDVYTSNYFLSFSSGKLELKSKTLDKVGGVVLHFIPLFMLSVRI